MYHVSNNNSTSSSWECAQKGFLNLVPVVVNVGEHIRYEGREWTCEEIVCVGGPPPKKVNVLDYLEYHLKTVSHWGSRIYYKSVKGSDLQRKLELENHKPVSAMLGNIARTSRAGTIGQRRKSGSSVAAGSPSTREPITVTVGERLRRSMDGTIPPRTLPRARTSRAGSQTRNTGIKSPGPNSAQTAKTNRPAPTHVPITTRTRGKTICKKSKHITIDNWTKPQ